MKGKGEKPEKPEEKSSGRRDARARLEALSENLKKIPKGGKAFLAHQRAVLDNKEKNKLPPAGEAFKEIVEGLNRLYTGKYREVAEAWSRSVEEKLREHTRIINLARNVMTVEVDSSVWMNELGFAKAEILRKMKLATGGLVQDLRFRVSGNA